MQLELKQQDVEFLNALLERELNQLKFEYNHTSTHAYKEIVKERERQVEEILNHLH